MRKKANESTLVLDFDEFVFGTDGDDYLRDASPNRPGPIIMSSLIAGGDGRDTLLSYMGEDALFGGAGSDTIIIYFNGSDLSVAGNQGYDTLEIHYRKGSDVEITERDGGRKIIVIDGEQRIEATGVENIELTHAHPWDY